MPDVLKHDRIVDVVALVFILLGVAFYADSQRRFHDITSYSWKHPGPRGTSQLVAADHARYEANTAFGLIALGAAVGVTGAVRHARRKG